VEAVEVPCNFCTSGRKERGTLKGSQLKSPKVKSTTEIMVDLTSPDKGPPPKDHVIRYLKGMIKGFQYG
jgi:hypothetical protein